MEIELLPADARREEVRAAWCELEAVCAPRYWLSWGWIETWLDTLPAAERPTLVLAQQDGRPLVAFFARVVPTRRARVVPSRALFVNEVGSPRHDVLHIEYNGWLSRPGVEIDVVRLLDGLPLGWDEVVLRSLDPQLLPAPLLARLGERYDVIVGDEEPSPQVDLDAVRAAPEGYLSLLGRSTRANVRRARRAYDERGSLSLERARDAAEARAFLAELAELSRRRFADGPGSAFDAPYFCAFHHELVRRRCAHGEIDLMRARVAGQTIGLVYNFVARGVVHFYQSGFAYEEDNRYKPGLVIHAEAIGRYAAAGQRVYDFLGGHARYK